jgi:hypothetical protein
MRQQQEAAIDIVYKRSDPDLMIQYSVRSNIDETIIPQNLEIYSGAHTHIFEHEMRLFVGQMSLRQVCTDHPGSPYNKVPWFKGLKPTSGMGKGPKTIHRQFDLLLDLLIGVGYVEKMSTNDNSVEATVVHSVCTSQQWLMALILLSHYLESELRYFSFSDATSNLATDEAYDTVNIAKYTFKYLTC